MFFSKCNFVLKICLIFWKIAQILQFYIDFFDKNLENFPSFGALPRTIVPSLHKIFLFSQNRPQKMKVSEKNLHFLNFLNKFSYFYNFIANFWKFPQIWPHCPILLFCFDLEKLTENFCWTPQPKKLLKLHQKFT